MQELIIDGESYYLVLDMAKDGKAGVLLDKYDEEVAKVSGAENAADCRRKLVKQIERSL